MKISNYESDMQHKASNKLFFVAAVTGVACVTIAALANAIGISEGPVGKPRFILGAVGVVLMTVGILRRRFFNCYKTAAVILANTALLFLCLEAGAAILNRYVLPQKAELTEEAFIEVSHLRSGPAMYVGFRGKPYAGELVNVNEQGLRVTPNEVSDGTREAEPLEVFTFGGSTMWGEGSAENETIATYLQTKLAAKLNRDVRATNHGQRAWVATQSLVQLMLELRDGRVPDVVVFYDGYNDVTAVYATGKVGVPENFVGFTHRVTEPLVVNRFRSTEIGRMLRPFIPRGNPPQLDVESTAARIVDNYIGVIDIVQALSQQYDFAVRFYWQPQLYGDPKLLTDKEQELLEHKWLPPVVKSLTTETYKRMAAVAKTRTDLEDISDAFSGMAEPIYLDPCHVRAIGNERVADVMLERGLLDCVTNHLESRKQSAGQH
ncbi:MAG: hypothetical protein AB8G99_06055 [Planctomycetaceae bacterium]